MGSVMQWLLKLTLTVRLSCSYYSYTNSLGSLRL